MMNSTRTQRAHRSAPRHTVSRRFRRQSGFTLIEAALATIIISTGVLSILAAQQAYHRKNQWADKSGTAMLLANEIRELTFGMPLHDPVTGNSNLGPETGETAVVAYDDIDDFAGNVGADKTTNNGTVFVAAGDAWVPTGAKRMIGPINALGNTITDMPGWSQHVKVMRVRENNISSTLAITLDDPTGVMRVTVDVLYQGPYDTEAKVFGTLSWIATP